LRERTEIVPQKPRTLGPECLSSREEATDGRHTDTDTDTDIDIDTDTDTERGKKEKARKKRKKAKQKETIESYYQRSHEDLGNRQQMAGSWALCEY